MLNVLFQNVRIIMFDVNHNLMFGLISLLRISIAIMEMSVKNKVICQNN
jgi:hypothetical protein